MTEELKGIVIKIFGLYYTVSSDNGIYNCILRGKLRKDKRWKNYSNPIAVGDRVLFVPNNDDTGSIINFFERRNLFSRKDKGKNKKEDIIAANIDLILVIQSFVDPMMNLRFVDRLVVRGRAEGIPVVLCLNKFDLATDDFIRYVEDYYNNTDLEIIIISAAEKIGLDRLKKRIHGTRSVLAGYSGVGKTTILNTLYPGINLKTSDISFSTGKGRHTTSNVSLITLNNTTQIVDTPGVREFGIVDIDPNMLDQFFYEFGGYASKCGFKQCTHDHEPRCEIKRMVEKEIIFEDRYISYLHILHSIQKNIAGYYR